MNKKYFVIYLLFIVLAFGIISIENEIKAEDQIEKSEITVVDNTIEYVRMFLDGTEEATVEGLILHLKNIDKSFPELKDYLENEDQLKNYSEVIVEHIRNKMNEYPEKMKELFPDDSHLFELEIRTNEKLAMEYFRVILKAPKDKIPRWRKFVETITSLLEKSEKYCLFRNVLSSLKDALTGPFRGIAMIQIKSSLMPLIEELPEKIKEEASEISPNELHSRISTALR